jgi:hypothetical protein
MSANNKTYQPAHTVSIKAGEDLEPFRFISHLGTLCATETKSLGVTEISWNEDDIASVVTLGVMPVETSGVIAAGNNVTADTDGKAKAATGTMPVNGRAIDDAGTGEFVRINLVP